MQGLRVMPLLFRRFEHKFHYRKENEFVMYQKQKVSFIGAW